MPGNARKKKVYARIASSIRDTYRHTNIRLFVLPVIPPPPSVFMNGAYFGILILPSQTSSGPSEKIS